MAIVQISKIQQRSGNLVDLPQLDEAEFGWASDNKRLFIGKTTPNENVEVLTAYSNISFSQLDGSDSANLNLGNTANGQILGIEVVGSNTYVVNKGGNVGGLIDLGNVGDITISGGAIGYVLETDGLGNLSWTPKSTITSYIQNVTQANPAVVTTTQDNFFTEAAQITITDPAGMTDLNGNTYYVDVLTSNTFALYTDSSLTVAVNSTGYNAYAYTSVTGTAVATNQITVGNSALFSLDQEVMFLGDLSTSGLLNDTPYYIKSKPSSTLVTVSYELLANGTAGNVKTLQTTTLTANMYATGGRAISSVGGSGTSAAGGSNTAIQFNDNNVIQGNAGFTFNKSTGAMAVPGNITSVNATLGNLATSNYFAGTLTTAAQPNITSVGTLTSVTVSGNATVGNLGSAGTLTATRIISNIATGTAPFTVTSTTQVANLSVATAGSATTAGTVTTAAQPNITSVGTLTSLTVSGNATVGNLLGALANGNSNVSIPSSNGNINLTAVGNTVLVITGTGANITGTANVSGNANVGNLGTTGNITAGNVNGGNLVTANYFTGTLTTAAQPNITSVGTLTSLTVTGNISAGNVNVSSGVILTTQLTTGANTTAGNITGNWTLTSGSKLEATYADLAEYYEADGHYQPGTVLAFGGEKEVTIAEDGTTKVAGVVSTNPAYAMNANCQGIAVAIALQGRVPTKVRGTVRKGDMMVSAGNGFARPWNNPQMGTVIGKALENFDGIEGVIEIAVGRL